MPIDLSAVNISLDEFQRTSSGWYNAGEVKLHDENTLDKVNNHVATCPPNSALRTAGSPPSSRRTATTRTRSSPA